MKRLNSTISKDGTQLALFPVTPSKKQASLQETLFELGMIHANTVKKYISNKKERDIKALILITKAYRFAQKLA